MATALLEKQDVKSREAEEAETAPPEYHWTVDAFMKAADAGVFGHEARLELIQGRIWEIVGQGSRPSTLASVIADMLREATLKRFAVREEKPVLLAADSQPIPDILVLNGRQADYNDNQPGPEDVTLIVEVSVTTVEYDLGEKALQYARAGVREYWVVVEKENTVVVHREPSPDGYKEVARLDSTDTLSPLAMPDVVWTIDALLRKRSDA